MIKEFIQKKQVIYDFCLNITAAALPVAMLQLIIYPQIAKIVGGNEYGLMLTIYSIWMVLPFTLGNVLNNIKLLKYLDYQKLGEEGDIALLLRQWIAFCSVLVFILIWCYSGVHSFRHILVETIIAVLIFLKAYLEVGFRIELNYKYMLISNVLLSLGFLVGFFVFTLCGIWEAVFVFGYLFSCFFCLLKTKIIKEKPQRTSLFSSVKKDAYSLVTAIVIKNLTGYADKLVLYPLMGGLAVSIYYTATILGKITGMLTGPINSVILSYIMRWDKSKAEFFSKILFGGVVFGIIGYIIVLLIARPIIGILFPQWVTEVMELIPLTTVTIMLGVVRSVLHPFVLKYCKIQWQIWINATGSIIYFISALVLWHYMGLKGFCIGTIIGTIAKLIIMTGVYYKSVLYSEL